MKFINLAVLTLCVAGFAATAENINGKELWKKSVSGRKNLAAGKVLSYSPAPSYKLTTDKKDPSDLTDGKLSKRPGDRIWFDPAAVGWRTNEIYIMLDLEEKKDLDKVVIRTLGGAPRFSFPDKIESFVSNDGKLWHRAGSLSRLQPGEMQQHDNINFFYYDESQPSAVPLYLNLQAAARYVLLKVTARGFFFADEMAVLEAESKDTAFNDAFNRKGEELPLTGFIAKIRTGKLALSNEFFMTQFFDFSDLRTVKNNKSKVELVLELPEAIEVYNKENSWQCSKNGNLTRWSRILDLSDKYNNIGIKLRSKEKNLSGTAYVSTNVNGKLQFKTPVSIEVLQFPEFEPFEKLHISLAWIGEDVQRFWPDFFTVWKRLGFNAVSAFPLHRKGGYTPEVLKFFENARKNNLKVILNLSPLKEMERVTPKKDLTSIKCYGGKKPFTVCPAYFGTHWQKECDRLTKYVKQLKPDYVFFDIEGWGEAEKRTESCKRCNKEAQKAGISRRDYLLQCGKKHVADLKKAVQTGAEAVNIAMPKIGSYDRSPAKPIYQITRFTDEYPAYTDMAQPSLYFAGNAEKVHNTVRLCAEKMNYNKQLIPFLTAGTYGEFDPEKIEPMILESFLNGSGGITYFNYRNFDTPEDYFYHARALSYLRKYEDLIVKGKMLSLKIEPVNAIYSALQSNKEILLLAGNYSKTTPKVKITLPGKAAEITDAVTNKSLKASGNELTLDIPSGKYRLIYIKL